MQKMHVLSGLKITLYMPYQNAIVERMIMCYALEPIVHIENYEYSTGGHLNSNLSYMIINIIVLYPRWYSRHK